MTNTRTGIAAAAALVVTLGACGLASPVDQPNQDKPSINALEEFPTPSIIYATAQGLFDGMRIATSDVLSEEAHYGREGYYLAVARTILDEFDQPLTPAIGIGFGNAYNNIRTTNSLRHAVDAVSGISDADKEAVRGFAETVEAYILHTQLRVHDAFGLPVQTDVPRSDLAPLASKADAYTFIIARLDDAAARLQKAGAAFPFKTTAGFTGFNTPANLIRFNRALKARVLNEKGDYAGALTALGQSFLDPNGDLSVGVYNSYGTASGDRTNPYYDPTGVNYLADTLLVLQAKKRADGTPDARVTNKTAKSTYLTHTRVTSNYKWTIYASPSAPIPIIKNEELILIRAEARMFTGDRAGALADLNIIRTRSGGLAPLAADPGDPGLLNELLYNRRYSLLFEYGHSWVDLRRFNRLADLVGPRGPGDRIFDRVPFPRAECDQRGGDSTTGCVQVDGTRTTK
jgi:hypothetical protein